MWDIGKRTIRTRFFFCLLMFYSYEHVQGIHTKKCMCILFGGSPHIMVPHTRIVFCYCRIRLVTFFFAALCGHRTGDMHSWNLQDTNSWSCQRTTEAFRYDCKWHVCTVGTRWNCGWNSHPKAIYFYICNASKVCAQLIIMPLIHFENFPKKGSV